MRGSEKGDEDKRDEIGEGEGRRCTLLTWLIKTGIMKVNNDMTPASPGLETQVSISLACVYCVVNGAPYTQGEKCF